MRNHAFINDLCLTIVGEIKEGILRIGNTTVQVHNRDLSIKVPDVLFYENAQVGSDNCNLCFFYVHYFGIVENCFFLLVISFTTYMDK